MFQLAVSAEMLFRSLPFVERVRKIAAMGFQVEMWDWTSKDIGALKAADAVFSSMTGYIDGDLLTPHGIESLLRSAKQSVEVAQELGVARLNLHGGALTAEGPAVWPVPVVTGEMWLTAQKTLAAIAEIGKRAN